MPWQPPELFLHWGPYEAPSAEEEEQIVDRAIKAHDAGIIRKATAVRAVASIFGIQNVSAYTKKLEEEAEEHGKLELAMAQAAMKSAAKKPGDPAAGPPAPPSEKQPSPAKK